MRTLAQRCPSPRWALGAARAWTLPGSAAAGIILPGILPGFLLGSILPSFTRFNFTRFLDFRDISLFSHANTSHNRHGSPEDFTRFRPRHFTWFYQVFTRYFTRFYQVYYWVTMSDPCPQCTPWGLYTVRRARAPHSVHHGACTL